MIDHASSGDSMILNKYHLAAIVPIFLATGSGIQIDRVSRYSIRERVVSRILDLPRLWMFAWVLREVEKHDGALSYGKTTTT